MILQTKVSNFLSFPIAALSPEALKTEARQLGVDFRYFRIIRAGLEPKEAAVVGRQGHQKWNCLIAQGNDRADQGARLAAHTKTPKPFIVDTEK